MSEIATHPSPAREHMLPHSNFEKQGRLKIVIAGLDKNIRTQAIEAANARLNGELGEGGFTKKFLKNIWKGNMAREYYLARYTHQAEQEILEHENLLQHEGLSPEDYRLQTTLRFAGEYDELIHREAGEHRHTIIDRNEDGSVNVEGYELKQRISRLIENYAAGDFDHQAHAAGSEVSAEEAFNEEKKRLITDMVSRGTLSRDQVGEGLLYTDNLLQIAQNVKALIEHRQAIGESGNIDEILANTDIVVGEAKLGVRTEVVQSHVERITKKLEAKGRGFINEATIATAVSAAFSLGGWATKSAVGAVSRVGVVSLAAGTFAGMREARVLKEERAQHAREMAAGKGDAETLTGRREDLEAARYATKSAEGLKDQLSVMYDSEGTLRITDRDSFDAALQILAECQARIQLSDRENVDLISFSNVGSVEKERFALDFALAKAKCDVRRFITEASDDQLRAFGIADADITQLRNADTDALNFILGPRIDGTEGVLGELNEEIRTKDRIYRKLRTKRVTGAVLKGTVLGMVVGTAGQEAAHGIMEVSGAAPIDRQTVLESVFTEPQQAFELTGNYSTIELGENTKLNMPEEFHIEQVGNEMTLTGPEGMRLDGITLTPDGNLTTEAAQRLEAAGFQLSHEASVISQEAFHTATVTPETFISNHSDLTTHVTRDFWYDNGTANIYEGSELGAQFSGTNTHGDYVVSISGMEGSATSSAGGEINWREAAANGELKVALSVSTGTQAEVFMVDIDANGDAIIPKDGPLAALFNQHGDMMQFNGKYAEVVQVAGVDESGLTHIRPLATVVGEAHSVFTDSLPTTETHNATTYTLNYAPPIQETETSIPPTMPIYGRRGLRTLPGEYYTNNTSEIPTVESTEAARASSQEVGYAGYTAHEQLREWERVRSPRLQDNPEAELNARQELNWYFDNQDTEYVNQLDERVKSNGNLQDLDSNTELMINIPVAGAHEKDNIYRTLSLYADQDTDALSKTQFVLSVNWKEGSNREDIEATIAEIERARIDFPQLRISFFREEWPAEFIKERNGAIYGTVIKSLYDTSLRSVWNTNEHGVNIDPLIVTNDADAKAISRNYLVQLIRSRERNPRADVLMGKIHWGTETFRDYPGFGVVSSFFMLLEDRVRDIKKNITPASWGPNSAFKASTVAAVGGVNGNMGAGADSELGKRIVAARRPVTALRVASNTYGNISLDSMAGFVAEAARGAWVDSSPERLLELYKTNEKPLTGAWDTFDSGGYTPRPDLGVGDAKENVARDFDTIKARVESQFSGILSSGWAIVDDNEIIDAALENLFFKPVGKTLWTISGPRYNRTFKFTPDGERELRVALDTIHTSVREGLEMIDEVYANSRRAAGGARQTQTPTSITPPLATSTGPSMPQEDNVQPTPNQQRTGTSSYLRGLIEGRSFDAYFDFYNGSMKYVGATDDGESYTFEPIDASGNPRLDQDLLVLDRQEAERALRRGNLAPIKLA